MIVLFCLFSICRGLEFIFLFFVVSRSKRNGENPIENPIEKQILFMIISGNQQIIL